MHFYVGWWLPRVKVYGASKKILVGWEKKSKHLWIIFSPQVCYETLKTRTVVLRIEFLNRLADQFHVVDLHIFIPILTIRNVIHIPLNLGGH